MPTADSWTRKPANVDTCLFKCSKIVIHHGCRKCAKYLSLWICMNVTITVYHIKLCHRRQGCSRCIPFTALVTPGVRMTWQLLPHKVETISWSHTDVQVCLYPVDFSRPGRREGLVLTCLQPGRPWSGNPCPRHCETLEGTSPWDEPCPALLGSANTQHTYCVERINQSFGKTEQGWFSIVTCVHAKLL